VTLIIPLSRTFAPVAATYGALRETSQYICELHNDVNYMTGKDAYDCSPAAVLKRWHPTYPDMEDVPTIEEQIAQEQKKSDENSPVPEAAGGSMAAATTASNRWSGWSRSGGGTSSPSTIKSDKKVQEQEETVPVRKACSHSDGVRRELCSQRKTNLTKSP
jgi:hypothetical protein